MDYNKLLRRLRQRIFDYDGQQEIKASRLILKVKDKLGHNDGHSTTIKPFKQGIDFVRNSDWTIKHGTEKQAIRLGNKRMPKDLKQAGFETIIWAGPDYYRINYGKKFPKFV